MPFRTHLLTPVSTSGRIRWVNLESPDDVSVPLPAGLQPFGAVPAPATTARPSMAALEQAVDLVVLVLAHRREQTLAHAMAMLPDPLPCAAILTEVLTTDTDAPRQDLLSLACVHGITEAGHEEILIPGHVWVASPGRALTLARRGNAVHTQLLDPAAIDGGRALDALLNSAAETFGARTLVVFLGDTAAAGQEGFNHVRSAGGRIILTADEANHVKPLLTARAETRRVHGSWPLAELVPVVRDCILHGRHDPRRSFSA